MGRSSVVVDRVAIFRAAICRGICGLVCLALGFVACTPALADLQWENFFTDEDAIVDGSQLTAGATQLTFSTQVFSDSDGGTFDLVPDRSADFFTFESGTTGNHTGFLEMNFNNENDDPTDFIELTIDFFGPVTNLQFSLLDVDGSGAGNWDDGVEVFFNGVNVKTDPSLYQYGSVVIPDNESYMDGFEAVAASASANEVTGNIDFDFGSQAINSITIRYFSTDDAVADPSAQFVGISDLIFNSTAIPEPSALAGMIGLSLFVLTGRRQRTAAGPVA